MAMTPRERFEAVDASTAAVLATLKRSQAVVVLAAFEHPDVKRRMAAAVEYLWLAGKRGPELAHAMLAEAVRLLDEGN